MDYEKNKKRFSEYIKIQLLDESYISTDKEKKILSEGVNVYDFDLKEAREILLEIAFEKDLIFEKDVNYFILEVMHVFHTQDQEIGYKEFYHVVNLYQQLTKGSLNEDEIKSRIKQMMYDNHWKPGKKHTALLKTWGSINWFTKIPV